MALADLLWSAGKQNMGGLLSRAYWIPIDDVDTATLPALSAVGSMLVTANIPVKAGKGFIEMYSTPEKNKLDDTTVGEVDGKSKQNIYEAFFPGDEVACAEFEAYAMNTPGLLLVPDTRGRKRIVGLCRLDPATTVLTHELPANLIDSPGSSGAVRADLKGKTFRFQAAAPHAPLFYTGAVPLLRDVAP
jgi:hypothetical protein